MKAVSVVFDYANDDYSRLMGVLKRSWKENATIPLEILTLQAPDRGERQYPYIANTRKLEAWRDAFDQDTIFIDCDMLCLRCPSDGFHVKDIGIAKRSHVAPFNGGVIYLRYTKRSRDFMDDLVRVNARMLKDREFHSKWRMKYTGINQAAMGYLFENGYSYDQVPEDYNLCPPFEQWRGASLIHIKLNHLRSMCLHGDSGPKPLEEVAEIWRSYAD